MTQADHMKTIELAITTLGEIGDVDAKELSYHATGALAAIKQRLAATPQAVPDGMTAQKMVYGLTSMLKEHHKWQCENKVVDPEFGFSLSNEYGDSYMCDRTIICLDQAEQWLSAAPSTATSEE